MGVLNHKNITPSMLHLVQWAYVKVFEYWYEYRNEISILKVYFHLFNMQHTFSEAERGKWLLLFHEVKKMFNVFL